MTKSKWDDFKFDHQALILCKKETYSRTTSGKSWHKNPDKTENQVIKPENYELVIQSNSFFDHFGEYSRIYCGYTYFGYIPVEIVSVSPGYITKVKYSFDFVRMEWLTDTAGWRENYIVNHAISYSMEVGNMHRVLSLYTGVAGDTSRGEFDLISRKWVG